MSPAGGGKPLFDLIPDDGRTEPKPRQDTARPTIAPAERPTEVPEMGVASPSWGGLTGTWRVRAVWVYSAAGLMVVALTFFYAVGYRLGAAAERDRWRDEAARDAREALVDDPLVRGSENPGQSSPVPRPVPGRSGAVITKDGVVADDPRIKGNNYLELATLPREQAEQAVRYLAQQDLDAIAVPADGVDRGGRGRNTSDPHRVVAIELAVPSERFSALRRERERLESRVRQVGKAWAASGGASDFSDPLWRRHGD